MAKKNIKENAIIVIDSLHISLQSIENLLLPSYWMECCPWLTVSDRSQGALATTMIEETIEKVLPSALGNSTDLAVLLASQRKIALIERGFFKICAVNSKISLAMMELLETAVLRLVALGHAPSAITMFDEAWEIGASLENSLTVATGNVSSGDTVAFLVTPTMHVFTGPHRDKPLADASSFRSDGSPMFVTAWLALNDATVDNSCLYFVPADRDPGL